MCLRSVLLASRALFVAQAFILTLCPHLLLPLHDDTNGADGHCRFCHGGYWPECAQASLVSFRFTLRIGLPFDLDCQQGSRSAVDGLRVRRTFPKYVHGALRPTANRKKNSLGGKELLCWRLVLVPVPETQSAQAVKVRCLPI